MARAVAWNVLWLGVLACGCHTVPVSGEPDPLVEALVEDGAKRVGTPLDTALIRREIEIGTPLPLARSIMELHGFSCWSGLNDVKGNYVLCTAYTRTPHAYKIVVKLFYDSAGQAHVTDVEATVDYDVWHVLRPS